MAETMTEQTATESESVATEDVVGDKTPDISTSTEASDTPTHWSRREGMDFDDETVGWLENKNFENPQAAITSQRELEKKMGGPSEMLQKWPEADDKEGFDAIYRRLGTPEKVEDYKVEFEEGAPVDADTLAWFKEKALGHNLTNAQVQGMALDWNAEAARIQAEQQQALEVQNEAEKVELRIKWGTKHDERLDYGHRALLAHGLTEENIDSMQAALGPKLLAELAAKVGDTMGEDTIASNTATPAFGTSKEQIQTQIRELEGELNADNDRWETYRKDSKPDASKESTGKDFRKMQILQTQLRNLLKAEKGIV